MRPMSILMREIWATFNIRCSKSIKHYQQSIIMAVKSPKMNNI